MVIILEARHNTCIMAECCPPGSHPALVADADRKVNGTERLLGDLNMYISQPAEATDKAVICIYDVHGEDVAAPSLPAPVL